MTPGKNTKVKNVCSISNSTILRWTNFLMVPLTILYDEIVAKIVWTEKPISVYSSSLLH